MKIENFPGLLSRVLQGEKAALYTWNQYRLTQSFDVEMLQQAFNAIKTIFATPQHPQKIHAIYLRAYICQFGLENFINYPEAIRCYELLIPVGHPAAIFNLASMYQNGIGCAVNHPKAIKLYEMGITRGDPYAMGMRAFMHEQGVGCPFNLTEAIKLYERAIPLKLSYAMVRRAHLHQLGTGGAVNYSEAIKLYDLAISMGNVEAMNYRADMHRLGLGGAVNYLEAIKLYEMGITRGDPNAMGMRAFMHEQGVGCPFNLTEAIKLYERAIPLKLSYAMVRRAHLHQLGIGGAVNYSEAIKLYDLAISMGNVEAMNYRADMHRLGLGGAVNYLEAIKLYQRLLELLPVGEKTIDIKKQIQSIRNKILAFYRQDTNFSDLFSTIRDMRDYGTLLCTMDIEKGDTVHQLAIALRDKLENFLMESYITKSTSKSLELFVREFNSLLHSKDKEICEHRAIWKPITANIGIALTGVGLIAIITKAAINSIDAYRQNKLVSFNNLFFLAKTNTQQFEETIERSLNSINSNTLNLNCP